MSPLTQRRLIRYVVPIIAIAGGLMGLARWTYQKSVAEPLAQKLDASRFVADSINRTRDYEDLKETALDILCSKSVDPTNRRCK